MAIIYKCRHCSTQIGKIDQHIETETLGFDHLTSMERKDMLEYNENGDVLVHVICEDCHEALIRNPDLYELDQLIQ